MQEQGSSTAMPVRFPDTGTNDTVDGSIREEISTQTETETSGDQNGDAKNPNVRLCYLRHRKQPEPLEMTESAEEGTESQTQTKNQQGAYGISISRSAWDPYPWVCGVSPGGAAEEAGLRRGDCLLKVGSTSLLGLPVSEVAEALRSDGGEEGLRLEVWNAEGEEEVAGATGGRRKSGLRGPLPSALQRLSSCLSTIVATLECPVCLECPLPPPAQQCPNGHILCLRCRLRSCRCPICRINLAPMAATSHGHPHSPNIGRGRCLLADEIHSILDTELGIGDSGGIRPTKRPDPVATAQPQRRVRQNTAMSTANRLLARIGLGKAVSLGDIPGGTSAGLNDSGEPSRPSPSPLTSRILGRITNGKSHSLENLSTPSPPPQNLSPSCENIPMETPASPMTSRFLSKIVMGRACYSLEHLPDNIVVVNPTNNVEATLGGTATPPHLSDRLINRLNGKSFSLENVSRSSANHGNDDDQADTANLIAIPRALDRETGIGL